MVPPVHVCQFLSKRGRQVYDLASGRACHDAQDEVLLTGHSTTVSPRVRRRGGRAGRGKKFFPQRSGTSGLGLGSASCSTGSARTVREPGGRRLILRQLPRRFEHMRLSSGNT
jgi:hypothetical protein